MTKQTLIAELIDCMWDTEWFENIYTRGCYGEEDFRDDIGGFDLDELKALRQYQIDGLSGDLFWEHLWNGETITYRPLG